MKWTVKIDTENGDRLIVDEDEFVVCRRPSPSDASIIAAAPEVLVALKQIHERCECQNEDETCVYLQIIRKAETPA